MLEIPNYLLSLIKKEKGNKLCIDNQRDVLKKLIKIDIKKVSELIGVSDRLVYYWLKNEKPIPIHYLIKIEEIYKISIVDEAYQNAKNIHINGVKQKTRLIKKLTPELCYLIGYIFGDGHIGKYAFSITDFSENNMLLAKDLLKKFFNINFNISFRKEKNYYEINSSWKAGVIILNKIFQMPIGKKNGRLILPEIIKKSNLQNQRMFALGFAAADYGGNSLTQTSYPVIKDLHKIFKKIGIPNKVYGPYGPYRGGEVKKWIISFNKESQLKLNDLLLKTLVKLKNT